MSNEAANVVDRDVGEAVGFRFGQLAVADVHDLVEQFAAHLLIGLLAADVHAFRGERIHPVHEGVLLRTPLEAFHVDVGLVDELDAICFQESDLLVASAERERV